MRPVNAAVPGSHDETQGQDGRHAHHQRSQRIPSQIESVLLDLGMAPNYRMIVDRQNNLDTLEVQVEMNESMFADTVRSLERVEKTIANALQSTLNIAAKITLLEPKSIERSEGKKQNESSTSGT